MIAGTSTDNGILTPEQIEYFKTNGYLVLEKFVKSNVVESWRKQIWNHLDADLSDPSGWPDEYVVDGLKIEPESQIFGQLPQVRQVVDQIGGGVFDGGGGQVLAQWPRKDEGKWQMPTIGHIDGYGPNGWSGGFMLGATTYMYDVQPGGGAFTYWPKSHLTTHTYFLDNPTHIDGSFRDFEGWGWEIFSDQSPEPPREFLGKAGDVIFWHCFLCHTGSANIHDSPRFGVFARWSYRKRERMRYEVPENLWTYWTI